MFQQEVIKHALGLFEYPSGPILQDFPRDADMAQTEPAVPACPVDFSARADSLTDREKLLQQFRAEFSAMNSWHTIALQQRQRTTTGISGLSADSVVQLFTDFIQGNCEHDNDKELADLLRRAAEDLKAFYFEALAAQPDQPTSDKALAAWFWGQTCGAAVINEARKICLTSETKEMLLAGKLLLVPRSQMYRFA